ncbi:hypothetical protein JW887_04915 [Candidatus Dojkabacteria bacterium]|nr:hypothetical protein [Candidatus Dojkabacteria bacterium]
MNKSTELEYRFTIPRSKLQLRIDKQVGQFHLDQTYETLITDILLERNGTTLKSENIGIRVRNIDNKYEFTYKKFLGLKKGIAKFDEITQDTDDKTFENFAKEKFDLQKFPILNDLSKKGKLYVMVSVQNKRTVSLFSNNATQIEFVLEDITYSKGKKQVQDAMIEIELKKIDNTFGVEEFIQHLQKLYSAEPSTEGKNTRAMRLLGFDSY